MDAEATRSCYTSSMFIEEGSLPQRFHSIWLPQFEDERQVSWFSVIWKNRLGELATVTPQVEAMSIVPRLGMGTTGSSSLFRAATGNVGSGIPSRRHKSMAAS
jgi:hypothetical protein